MHETSWRMRSKTQFEHARNAKTHKYLANFRARYALRARFGTLALPRRKSRKDSLHVRETFARDLPSIRGAAVLSSSDGKKNPAVAAAGR
jgi:hypothetical protein